jgi:ZIP family zinc transporter
MLGILAGAGIMMIVDRLIPHIHPQVCSQDKQFGLKRTALYLFVGIFIHNFPEGLAMGIGSVSNFKLSLTIALAIAIHDIPEGICTSAPYYKATGKRLKSFLISSSTIVPTLIGFFLAHFLFQQIPLYIVGLLIGATAGLMIYISGDELIPSSCCRSSGHNTIISLMMGVLLVLVMNAI